MSLKLEREIPSMLERLIKEVLDRHKKDPSLVSEEEIQGRPNRLFDGKRSQVTESLTSNCGISAINEDFWVSCERAIEGLGECLLTRLSWCIPRTLERKRKKEDDRLDHRKDHPGSENIDQDTEAQKEEQRYKKV